jgi:hypothetical protein
MSDHTQPSKATRDEEERQAQRSHDGGRGPTADEEALADANTASPAVAEHEDEMLARGAGRQGEGRLP